MSEPFNQQLQRLREIAAQGKGICERCGDPDPTDSHYDAWSDHGDGSDADGWLCEPRPQIYSDDDREALAELLRRWDAQQEFAPQIHRVPQDGMEFTVTKRKP